MISPPRSPAQRAAEEYFRICRQWRIARTMGGAQAMRQQLARMTELHILPDLPQWLADRIERRLIELSEDLARFLEPR